MTFFQSAARGELYDCDFNQMLSMGFREVDPLYLWDLDPSGLTGREIQTGVHCFACTAGAGSSCTGALCETAGLR